MRARRCIGLVFILVVLATLFFLAVRPRQPAYGGRTLDAWLRDLQKDRPWAEREAAEEAISQIGTNAVPHLLQLLRRSDPAFKRDVLKWVQAQTKLDTSSLSTAESSSAAVEAFRVLGPRARPWLPDLEPLVSTNDPLVCLMAAWAIANTRCDEAGPILARALSNSVPGVRLSAAWFAGRLGVHGRAVVPGLLGMLTNADPALRRSAALSLGQIALEPKTVVPALRCALADTDGTVVKAAGSALARFGKQRTETLPEQSTRPSGPQAFSARIGLLTQCEMREGAIIRGPTDSKRLALIFTAHEFAEGGQLILDELAKHHARASFFVTGAFLENTNDAGLIGRIRHEGHLLGPHSDRHLLYCSWETPPKTLVQWHEFRRDLVRNLQKLDPGNAAYIHRWEKGMTLETSWFLPAYEHYSREIVDWTRELGRTVINFTPGTRSTADYTGEADKNFVSSQAIFDSIVACERQDAHGLNGFLLLLHLGAGPGRADKFHAKFGDLLDWLQSKGYECVRVNELLEPK